MKGFFTADLTMVTGSFVMKNVTNDPVTIVRSLSDPRPSFAE